MPRCNKQCSTDALRLHVSYASDTHLIVWTRDAALVLGHHAPSIVGAGPIDGQLADDTGGHPKGSSHTSTILQCHRTPWEGRNIQVAVPGLRAIQIVRRCRDVARPRVGGSVRRATRVAQILLRDVNKQVVALRCGFGDEMSARLASAQTKRAIEKLAADPKLQFRPSQN